MVHALCFGVVSRCIEENDVRVSVCVWKGEEKE